MTRTVIMTAGIAVLAIAGAGYAVTVLRSTATCAGTAIAGGSIGGPFELVDETGTTVTDEQVIHEPSLIYFGYTFCPDVCPIDNARNAAAVDILAERGHSVTPIFATVDPARDTVEVMRDYTENFHPKMIGLTGTPDQTDAAAKTYRVFYQLHEDDPEYYLVDHTVMTYLTLPGSGFADFFRREDSPEQVADRVACILDNAS